MPDLDFAFLCDYVRVDRGLGYVVAAGVDTVEAEAVPVGANLGLLARFTFTSGECGHPHRVDVIVQDQDGKELGRLAGNLTPEWKSDLPPGWKVGAMLGFNFGVGLPDFGVYSVEILLNHSNVKCFNLRVKRPDG